MKKNIFIGVLIIFIVYILAAWGVSSVLNFNDQQIKGVIFSGILATLNIFLALIIIILTISKDLRFFIKIFLTSIIIRFLVMLAIIFTIIKFIQVDLFVFLASLFILYFMYQIWEVFILHSNINKDKS